ALPTALEQDADEVDQRLGAARGGLDRVRVAKIGLHGMDLADAPERLQVAGKLRTPHRNPDAIAALAQRADNVAAEKSGAAKNGDQRVHHVSFRFGAYNFVLVAWPRTIMLRSGIPGRNTPAGAMRPDGRRTDDSGRLAIQD